MLLRDKGNPMLAWLTWWICALLSSVQSFLYGILICHFTLCALQLCNFPKYYSKELLKTLDESNPEGDFSDPPTEVA